MFDHRQLANQLDLFHFEVYSPGMVFWHPKGWQVFQQLEQRMRHHYQKAGFKEVRTPQFLKRELWQRSGHWQKFSEDMFVGGAYDEESEVNDYALKPMSCPAHIALYQKGVHSYRSLPYRVFEFGLVHRNEPSGSLYGCMRLRQFTQDDAHVFCRWDQAMEEVCSYLQLSKKVYAEFGFEQLDIKLSTQPENSMGEKSDWKKAEALLAKACDNLDVAYELQAGEGAFYGPKLELSLKDYHGRVWQCGTVQLDFNLPEKFELVYRNKNGEMQQPVMIHQAVFGSLERWLGVLIENLEGRLPLWLAPVQVAILIVDPAAESWANIIAEALLQNNIRVEIHNDDESLAKKLKRCYQQKMPNILIIGKSETDSKSVTLRQRGQKQQLCLTLDKLLELFN